MTQRQKHWGFATALTLAFALATPVSAEPTESGETDWPLVFGLCAAVVTAWLCLRIWLFIRQTRRRRE